MHVEIERRSEAGWVVHDVIGAQAEVGLRSAGAVISLAELYEGLELA